MFKHVYILGAGFSIPLGGPAFNDLIKPKQHWVFGWARDELGVRDINDAYHLVSLDRWTVAFQQLAELWQGDNTPEVKIDVERLLELISDANEKHTSIMNVIQQRIGIFSPSNNYASHEFLLRSLKARLAIETYAFTDRVPDDSERWLPYKQWFKGLTSNDTIISFNYDLVCELLAEKDGRPYYDLGRTVIDNDGETIEKLSDPKSNSLPPLLKLHGSCDWMKVQSKNKSVIHRFQRRGLLWKLGREDSAIGIPGSGKPTLASNSLSDLWEKAKKRIADADIISIVGYSLPPTDNYAKRFFLDSIARSTDNKRPRLINIVLGLNNPAASRIKWILNDSISNHFTAIRELPLYTQDFLVSKPLGNLEAEVLHCNTQRDARKSR